MKKDQLTDVPGMAGSIRMIVLAMVVLAIPMASMHLYKLDQPPHARSNLLVFKSENLADALRDYPNTRPPLYPATLWAVHQATGLEAHTINIALFCLMLLIVARFTYRYIDRKYYVVPVALIAICSAFYYNASAITSETLLIAEAMVMMLLIARYSLDPRPSYAVLMGIIAGIMFYTRFFGLIWIFPTACLCLVLANTGNAGKLKHLSAFGVTVLVMSSLLLLYNLMTSGYLTGMDRFGDRGELQGLSSLLESMSFPKVLMLSLKTATYDLMSPDRIGTYSQLLLTRLSPYEMLLSAMVLLVVAAAIGQVVQISRSPEPLRALAPQHIPSIFALSYLSLCIAVWTFGNNDPIYTRFLFPMYPFLLLSAYVIFAGAGSKHGFVQLRNAVLVIIAILYVANQLVAFSNSLSGNPPSGKSISQAY
ncbi:MAG: glycosyltransferase family 39 protein [Thiohalobacterales bacterium]|nr:glycosyltransferase family 39 protein [Thiohalobacterales bacterium]